MALCCERRDCANILDLPRQLSHGYVDSRALFVLHVLRVWADTGSDDAERVSAVLEDALLLAVPVGDGSEVLVQVLGVLWRQTRDGITAAAAAACTLAPAPATVVVSVA